MMFEKHARTAHFPDIALRPHPLNATDCDDKVVLVDFQRRTNSTERALAPAPGAASPATTDGMLAIIARLLDDAGVALERDRRTARSCIARAAGLIHAERNRHAFAQTKGALAAWQVKRLSAFIDTNLGRNIATEDLTDLMQMSTGHFFRSFKRSFGETPFSFIARRRMLRPGTDVDHRRTPCQIALACGLCDQSHFTRVFRRVVGGIRTRGGAA
jgi:AraC-like DNA-binding protein